MFAPMMTEMACASVSKPAETNETVITVVADEDCTAQVTMVPVSIPLSRLPVIRAKMCLKLGPANFFTFYVYTAKIQNQLKTNEK